MTEGFVHSEKGFYVGDICYVLRDEIYRDVWGEQYHYDNGVWELTNGLRFAVAGTAYGDGVYEDNEGRYYPVDAGVIGLVPLELIEGGTELGNVFRCIGDALFEAEEGHFTITLPDGKVITINTEYDDDEDDDEEW